MTVRVAVWLLLAPLAALAQPFAYVANLGENTVSVIDVTTETVVKVLPTGGEPNGVALAEDGSRAYVANFDSGDVTVIDAESQSVLGRIKVEAGPVGVAVSPDGARAFVANRGSDSLSVIDASGMAHTHTIPVGNGPNSVAIADGGSTVLVTNSFTRSPGLVSFIDTRGLTAGTVAVQRNPNRVAVSPDGRTAYVTNYRSWNLSVLDVSERRTIATVRFSGRPRGIAVNPNGSFVYVTTDDGFLHVIDALPLRVYKKLPVGRLPSGIAVLRDGSAGYVANSGDDTVTVIDLVQHDARGTIDVGVQPFAIGIDCRNDGCRPTPMTALPTETPTFTLTPSRTSTRAKTSTPSRTATRSRTSTRPPTSTVTPTAVLTGGETVVRAASVTVRPGEPAIVRVRLDTGRRDIARVSVHMRLGTPLLFPHGTTRNSVDCVATPAVDSYFGGCDGYCSTAVAVVASKDESTPLLDGALLYSCKVPIHQRMAAGTYAIELYRSRAFTSDGTSVEIYTRSASITVTETARPTTTRGARPTRTPIPTTPSPTISSHQLVLVGSSVSVEAGDDTTVDVEIVKTPRDSVSSIALDLDLESAARFAMRDGRIDCSLNQSLSSKTAFFQGLPRACEEDETCRSVTVSIFDSGGNTPIPAPSSLFSCRINVPRQTPSGMYFLPIRNVGGRTPGGERISGIGQVARLNVRPGPPGTTTRLELSADPTEAGGTTYIRAHLSEVHPDLAEIRVQFSIPPSIAVWGRFDAARRCEFSDAYTRSGSLQLGPAYCSGDNFGSCTTATVTTILAASPQEIVAQGASDVLLFSCPIRIDDAVMTSSIPLRIVSSRATDSNGATVPVAVSATPIDLYPGPSRAYLETSSPSFEQDDDGVIDVRLLGEGEPIAGVETELYLPPGIRIPARDGGRPDCSVPDDHGKEADFYFGPSGCRQGGYCNKIKAMIVGLSDGEPIEYGSRLFSCRVEALPDAYPGRYPVEIVVPTANSAEGKPIPLAARDGSVVVVDPDAAPPTIRLNPSGPRVRPGELLVVGFAVNPWTATGGELRSEWMFARGLNVEPEGRIDCSTKRLFRFQVRDASCEDGSPGCTLLSATGDFALEAPYLPAKSRHLFHCWIKVDESLPAGEHKIRPMEQLWVRPDGSVEPVDAVGATFRVLPEPKSFIRATSVVGAPGDEILIDFVLDTDGEEIAALENSIELAEGLEFAAASDARPTCFRNRELEREATSFAFPQEHPRRRSAKAIVFSFRNLSPIPDGSVLYSCRVSIYGGAPGGDLRVIVYGAGASDAAGDTVPIDAISGTVTVATRSDSARVNHVFFTSTGICYRGTHHDLPCSTDADCWQGRCFRAPGVCDGGEDDGLLCDCPGGECRPGASCSDQGDGTCTGGSADGACCREAFRCSGAPCVPTRKICAGGISRGLPCTHFRQCRDSYCAPSSSRCNGGDFDSFACIDDGDCPLGSCQLVVPHTPTRPPIAPRTLKPTQPKASPTASPTTHSTPSPIAPKPTPSATASATKRPTAPPTVTTPSSPIPVNTTIATETKRPTAIIETTPPATRAPPPRVTLRPTDPLPEPTRTASPTSAPVETPRHVEAAEDDGCTVRGPDNRPTGWVLLVGLLLTLRRPGRRSKSWI